MHVNEIVRKVCSKKMGLTISGEKMNEISYADDKVVIAETEAHEN